jgi:tetratricopeptide (TPR) repeat protein
MLKIILSLTFLVSVGCESMTADGYTALGDEHLAKVEYQQAIDDYTMAIELEPTNPERYRKRADAYSAQEDHHASYEDDMRAKRLEPGYDFIVDYQYGSNGEHDAAIAAYTKAIKLNPDYADYYILRGVAYEQKGDKTSAIADYTQALLLEPDININGDDVTMVAYTRAIEQEPESGVLYFNRSMAYKWAKEENLATADFERAIKLEPDKAADYYYARGHTLYGDYSEYAEAVADYTQAITLDPTKAEYYFSRARQHENRKDYCDAYEDCGEDRDELYRKAIADYAQTIKLDPTNAEYYFQRGMAQAYEGVDLDLAIADFTKAIEVGTEKFSESKALYYSWRGGVYFKRGDYEAAIADWATAFVLDSRTTQIGRYFDEAALSPALAAYTQAIELKPADGRLYGARGSVYHDVKEYDKAIADMLQAIKLDPENAGEYYSCLAEIYGQIGEYDDEIAAWTKVIEWWMSRGIEPADLYTHRGLAYYNNGDYELADADYKKAVELEREESPSM